MFWYFHTAWTSALRFKVFDIFLFLKLHLVFAPLCTVSSTWTFTHSLPWTSVVSVSYFNVLNWDNNNKYLRNNRLGTLLLVVPSYSIVQGGNQLLQVTLQGRLCYWIIVNYFVRRITGVSNNMWNATIPWRVTIYCELSFPWQPLNKMSWTLTYSTKFILTLWSRCYYPKRYYSRLVFLHNNLYRTLNMASLFET